MSSTEDLPTLLDDDLLDLIMKDSGSFPENNPLEGLDLLDPELDMETDDMITSMLQHLKDDPHSLQDYLPIVSESVCEDLLLSHDPSSNSDIRHIVQIDHNYSCNQDSSVLESMKSDMAEGGVSTDFAMDLEGTSNTLGENSSFPTAAAADAEHQLVPGTTVEFEIPGLFLTQEEKQFLEEEGLSLPPCLTVDQTEYQLMNGVHQTQNKKPARASGQRKKSNMSGREDRLAACKTQNRELEKKVQLLQEQNRLLLSHLQKLQALVRQSANRTTTIRTMVIMLSLYLFLSHNVSMLKGNEPQTKWWALSQQNHAFLNRVVAVEQEGAAMEGSTPATEDPLLSGILSQLQEVFQGQPNTDPTSSNSASCPAPSAASGSGLGSHQPQEQGCRSYVLHVPVAWAAKKQEEVEHAPPIVIQQQHADEMSASSSSFLG
ncbi:cyclic AMP-responsive element-binding protein 3 isoform X2 [Tyto alba]|nr:cyclic AMP-responsive element-binding protein 3 isoform X2 [Tyto alba]XP_042660602.1 cyclic AMP-responsive element-binding protein 3 isoform X2 [Tyto alba]XP_042660603.1 cyclic AMP-responsive element-binding protein 3 isoform X2 [Tyto alba]